MFIMASLTTVIEPLAYVMQLSLGAEYHVRLPSWGRSAELIRRGSRYCIGYKQQAFGLDRWLASLDPSTTTSEAPTPYSRPQARQYPYTYS